MLWAWSWRLTPRTPEINFDLTKMNFKCSDFNFKLLLCGQGSAISGADIGGPGRELETPLKALSPLEPDIGGLGLELEDPATSGAEIGSLGRQLEDYSRHLRK